MVTTEVVIDFDAAASLVMAGESGKFILKPVIKEVGTVTEEVEAE